MAPNGTSTNLLDDFINYSNRTKTSYLSKWKEDGSTIVWLAKNIAPKRLWRHRLKRVVDHKDSQTNEMTKQIWSDNIVCLEPEDILKDQNLFVKLTGQRKRPPHTCPTCLFMEYVRAQILSRKIDWLAPVLRYETDEEVVVITAQGLLGYPKPDKLNDTQRRQLKEAGIFLKDGWKEDGKAKMNWVFCCAEHKHPEKGLQVAVEPAGLGDKVRSQMKKEMDKAELVQKDRALGNPLIHPYPFKWDYNDAEGIAFSEKYDATALVGTECPPEIEELINGEPPSIEGLMRQPNLVELRASLMKHCVLENVPWDAIFKPALAYYKEQGWEIGDEQTESSSEETTTTVTGGANVSGEDVYDCDACSAPMLASETVCKKCGKDYAPPPPPPPMARKSRSQAAASAPKIDVQVDDDFPKAEGGDEIPF